MQYNTGVLRDLLNQAFDDEALTTLCYDEFRAVYDQFSVGMSRLGKIQRLIVYVENHRQIEALLAVTEARNPAQYAQFRARLVIEESDPSPLPTPQPATNPFIVGGAVPPELFFGREDAVQAILNRVRTAQSISIVGERRMGKTSLLSYFNARAADLLPPDLNPLIIYLDLMRAKYHTRKGLMRALRKALTPLWREPWAKDEDGDLGLLDESLEELHDDGIRLILCLDEVENLTRHADEFDPVLETWRACGSMGYLSLVTASAQPLADLCDAGGLTSPFFNIFTQHQLNLLDSAAWQALVASQMTASPDDLAFIERMAGGQPFFTQLTARYLWEARQRGPVDFERLAQDIRIEIESHLRYQWRKLTPAEQTTLRQLASGSLRPDPNPVDRLTRRGLIRAGQPFSDLYSQMITNGDL